MGVSIISFLLVNSLRPAIPHITILCTFDPNITDTARELMRRRQLGLDQPRRHAVRGLVQRSDVFAGKNDSVSVEFTPHNRCGYDGHQHDALQQRRKIMGQSGHQFCRRNNRCGIVWSSAYRTRWNWAGQPLPLVGDRRAARGAQRSVAVRGSTMVRFLRGDLQAVPAFGWRCCSSLLRRVYLGWFATG
ncbi:MAG: hypothetical protein R2838_25450 [Caldilineaceae bacterium]